MASSKPVPCGPCKQENENTKAEIWCYNCGEGLCSTCSGHHKKFKSTLDHKTIDIHFYKPPIGSIKTECDKHNKQFKLYCPSHLKPCCDECISTYHSKCTGIESLTAVVEKTKIEKSKESVDKDITFILLFLNKMANEKTSNIRKGEHQCGNIKKSIGKIRKEINKHLDKLEKKLWKEANNVWGQEKSKLTGFVSEIEDKKKELEEMQDNFQTVPEQTSKLTSFLGIHQMGEKVHQYHRYIDDMECNEVDIKIEQCGGIEKILSDLQSLKSFGEVAVSKTDITINRETSVNRKAQVETQKQSSIDKMTMHIETNTKLEVNTKSLSDMICLSDGRIIVATNSSNIYLLTSNGKLQKQLSIPGEASCVTQISKDTIGITCSMKCAIKIFNIEDETVSKVIKLYTFCYGLSFFDESLAVGLNTSEIRIIDLEGNTLKSIQVRNTHDLKYLVYSDNRVIFSDYTAKTVHCYDESGKQIWKYKQDLLRPTGLSTDSYGNIIVADWDSSKIIAISKDGQNCKVLVRTKSSFGRPLCIFVRNNESNGYFCGEMRTLANFNLSYD